MTRKSRKRFFIFCAVHLLIAVIVLAALVWFVYTKVQNAPDQSMILFGGDEVGIVMNSNLDDSGKREKDVFVLVEEGVYSFEYTYENGKVSKIKSVEDGEEEEITLKTDFYGRSVDEYGRFIIEYHSKEKIKKMSLYSWLVLDFDKQGRLTSAVVSEIVKNDYSYKADSFIPEKADFVNLDNNKKYSINQTYDFYGFVSNVEVNETTKENETLYSEKYKYNLQGVMISRELTALNEEKIEKHVIEKYSASGKLTEGTYTIKAEDEVQGKQIITRQYDSEDRLIKHVMNNYELYKKELVVTLSCVEEIKYTDSGKTVNVTEKDYSYIGNKYQCIGKGLYEQKYDKEDRVVFSKIVEEVYSSVDEKYYVIYQETEEFEYTDSATVSVNTVNLYEDKFDEYKYTGKRVITTTRNEDMKIIKIHCIEYDADGKKVSESEW